MAMISDWVLSRCSVPVPIDSLDSILESIKKEIRQEYILKYEKAMKKITPQAPVREHFDNSYSSQEKDLLEKTDQRIKELGGSLANSRHSNNYDTFEKTQEYIWRPTKSDYTLVSKQVLDKDTTGSVFPKKETVQIGETSFTPGKCGYIPKKFTVIGMDSSFDNNYSFI